MVTILPALRQVREDLVGLLGKAEVRRVCRELEHTWRARRLDPWTTLHLSCFTPRGVTTTAS